MVFWLMGLRLVLRIREDGRVNKDLVPARRTSAS